MTVFLNVGGLVAAGFDLNCDFLILVSHSGRGVYSVGDWQLISRNSENIYPEKGYIVGLAPIKEPLVAVSEINYQTGKLQFFSPNRKYHIDYEDGVISILEVSDKTG